MPENSAAKARLFVGIPVQLNAYDAIRKHLSPLLRGRWADESQLHLTLAFLGTKFTPEEARQRLETCSIDFEASPLTHLGYFKRSHILYAGTEHPALHRLSEQIQDAFGLPRTELTPHATLMRVKALSDPTRFHSELAEFEGHRLGMLERRCVLYQSELHPDGARYRSLGVWPV